MPHWNLYSETSFMPKIYTWVFLACSPQFVMRSFPTMVWITSTSRVLRNSDSKGFPLHNADDHLFVCCIQKYAAGRISQILQCENSFAENLGMWVSLLEMSAVQSLQLEISAMCTLIAGNLGKVNIHCWNLGIVCFHCWKSRQCEHSFESFLASTPMEINPNLAPHWFVHVAALPLEAIIAAKT